jgi:Outer membrane protein beta-barrel domain
MKKLILLLIIYIPISFLSAQSLDESKIKFGILGGVNFHNLTGKDLAGEKLNSKGIFGFHAGINAQIPIVPEFYFQPGLLFSTKGSEIQNTGFNSKIKLSYLELPLNFVYKSSLGNGYFMLGFGPYVGYGINGKVTNTIASAENTADIKFKNSIELNDPLTDYYLRALDIGGNIFVGYEMTNGIFVQLNTQYGMVNISPDDKRNPTSESSIKNVGFGLSIGYRL